MQLLDLKANTVC